VPQSRHRKSKARKKPKGLYASPPPRPGNKSRNVRTVAILIVAVVAVAIVAYVLWRRGTQQAEGPETVTASGLKYVDLVVGDGPSPQIGQTLSVHYTGTLLNGQKFDSSLDTGQPMEFQYGRTPMIKGWDEGLKTMKVGGKRKLTIPPGLGYGAAGRPPKIPPNSTLLFEIELLEIK
jgi:FKBP-type peptidyl-prolyl cis-trans isomerase